MDKGKLRKIAGAVFQAKGTICTTCTRKCDDKGRGQGCAGCEGYRPSAEALKIYQGN